MKAKCCILIILLFILSGCSRTVENEDIIININGNDVNGKFTGTLVDNLATGEGTFIANEDNGGWEYKGAFDNNTILGEGTISNYSYEFIVNDTNISAMYEGQCLDGIPNGDGVAKGKIDESDFEYSGDFVNGEIGGNGKTSNFPYVITYSDENILGLYSGEILEGEPIGEGTFNSITEDVLFDYQGMWENGNLFGEGTLSTDKYKMEFSDGSVVGKYDGSVINGKASGDGFFTAINGYGEEYKYTGKFKDGMFNGYGEFIFLDEELGYPARKGTFTDGDYTPTKSELLTYIGTVPDFINYKVTEENLKFIDEHEELFLTDDKSLLDELHQNEITMNELYKKPNKYSEMIVSVSNCKVIQIKEEELYGKTITWFLCNDKYYNTVFVLADAELPKVNKNSRIRVYGLPIGLASYENGMGANRSAYVIYASYIE